MAGASRSSPQRARRAPRAPLPFPARPLSPTPSTSSSSTVTPSAPAATTASTSTSTPTPQEIVLAGVETATYRYGATCSFAMTDAEILEHWPRRQRLAMGAALVVGCVASDRPEHDGPQLTLAPRLMLPRDRDEAETARGAVHAVAARLAALAREGRTGRFVWRSWGAGWRLQQAREESGACRRCLANTGKRAEREQLGQAVRQVVHAAALEPPGAVRIYIAHTGDGGASIERQAI